MRIPFAFLLFVALLLPRSASAQEFNCSVSVDLRNLSGSEYTFLNDLRDQIDEYINERSWTGLRFQEHERIDCTMQITIEDAPTLSTFRARIVVASRRPIYGTTQNSTLLQINDPTWHFSYTQGMPLNFNLEQFDPLTSVLDFYAMLILGYDFDSFQERGGTPYFERARRLAELAQAQSAQGWTDLTGERGRADLVRQILDPRFTSLRDAYFNYHFHGLDHFVSQTDVARESVLQTVVDINELYETVSRQYAIDLFFSAKYQELTAIFENSQFQNQAYETLTTVDIAIPVLLLVVVLVIGTGRPRPSDSRPAVYVASGRLL